jgi:alanyl-tRNA synthetase
MSLERLASVLQQVPSNFDTDLFVPIHDRMRELMGHDPAAFEAERFSYQVIADHARAVVFLIADGVLPSNEGRGYVLAGPPPGRFATGGSSAGGEPFMADLGGIVIDIMGRGLPPHRRPARIDPGGRRPRGGPVSRTLDAGSRAAGGRAGATSSGSMLPRVVGRRPRPCPDDAEKLAGDVAVPASTTRFGFPIDTDGRARGRVRRRRSTATGSTAALAEQREAEPVAARRPRLARHAELSALYQAIQARRRHDASSATRRRPPRAGRRRSSATDGVRRADRPGRGEGRPRPDARSTPRAAGQVGDRGELREAGRRDRRLFAVEDTQKPVGGLIVMRGTLHGRLRVGETVDASWTPSARPHDAQPHGTHLLIGRCRNVVGEAARQAGSLVTPDYLRLRLPVRPAAHDRGDPGDRGRGPGPSSATTGRSRPRT